jgi:hypothetical protein
LVINFYWTLFFINAILFQFCSIVNIIRIHTQEKQNNTIQIPKLSLLHKTKAIIKKNTYKSQCTPILYINSVSLSVEVLKPRSFLIKLSPRTRGPKNYLGPRIFTSYFYFYVCFRTTTVVIDGGNIFVIWRVGEEIWVRFFWAKGLGGSWFLFFSGGGRGWGWGSRGLNRCKWTGVGNAKDWVGGDRRGALCTRFTLVNDKKTK